MIIKYDDKYKEQVKNLLDELQDHIVKLDKEKYNIKTSNYKEKYFEKTIKEVKENNGEILLYKENDDIIGLVIGIINNEETSEYDFKAPKRGRITELVVSKNKRSKGYGKILLDAMEEHLKELGCKDIMLEIFAYNEKAIKFYEKNGYHFRVIDTIKKIS